MIVIIKSGWFTSNYINYYMLRYIRATIYVTSLHQSYIILQFQYLEIFEINDQNVANLIVV